MGSCRGHRPGSGGTAGGEGEGDIEGDIEVNTEVEVGDIVVDTEVNIVMEVGGTRISPLAAPRRQDLAIMRGVDI